MRSILAILAITLLWSCAAKSHYRNVKVGRFEGKLALRWEGPDSFVYFPDQERPFTFRRDNGDLIRPEAMFTDGGSIPRPLWMFRNYSPWGYGPAFVIHDWLFDAHGCDRPGYEEYTIEEAALVMSECIKTLMETRDDIPRNEAAVYAMYLAVRSDVARGAWESNACYLPSPEPSEYDWSAGARPEMEVVELEGAEGEEPVEVPSRFIQVFDCDARP